MILNWVTDCNSTAAAVRLWTSFLISSLSLSLLSLFRTHSLKCGSERDANRKCLSWKRWSNLALMLFSKQPPTEYSERFFCPAQYQSTFLSIPLKRATRNQLTCFPHFAKCLTLVKMVSEPEQILSRTLFQQQSTWWFWNVRTFL